MCSAAHISLPTSPLPLAEPDITARQAQNALDMSRTLPAPSSRPASISVTPPRVQENATTQTRPLPGSGGTGAGRPQRDDSDTPSKPRTQPGTGGGKPAGGTSASPGVGAPAGKGVIEAPPLEAPGGVIVATNFLGGWISDYYFRGLNVLDRISPDHDSSGAALLRMDAGFYRLLTDDPNEGLVFGLGYVEAREKMLSNAAASRANGLDNEDFAIGKRQRYKEYDFHLNYTYPLIRNQLYGTVGLSHYEFNTPGFWFVDGREIDHATEFSLGLTYTGLSPWLTPSLTYYRDVNGFLGNYWEAKIRSSIPVLNPNPSVQGEAGELVFSPSLALSYDDKYNGDNRGWNSLEGGVNVRYQLSRNAFVEGTVNYVQDLGDSNRNGTRRTDSGFWAGLALGFNLDPLGQNFDPALVEAAGKGKTLVPTENPWRRWSISGGARYQELSVDFGNPRVPFYSVMGLFSHRKGSGDLGFATDTHDAHYNDGAVFGTQNYSDGTANFTYANRGQIKGYTGASFQDPANRHVLYHSDRYSYSESRSSQDFSSSDEDGALAPYIKATYDLWKSGSATVSAGFAYSFSQNEFDSGTGLIGLVSGYEKASEYTFVYQVDELFSYDPLQDPGQNSGDPDYYGDVIYDSDQFSFYFDSPADFGPHRLENSSQSELTRVALFANNRLRVTANEFSLPVEFKWDLNDRLHLSVSGGPTLTLFNSAFETDIYAQELTNVALSSRTLKRQTSYSTVPHNRSFAGASHGDPGAGSAGSASAGSIGSGSSPSRSSSSAAGGGGKGETQGAPRLPGRNVATWRSKRSQQDWQWGAFAQLGMTVDLDAQDRWFAEFFARYQWVQDFEVSNDFNSARIDASSWALGLGLGVRF